MDPKVYDPGTITPGTMVETKQEAPVWLQLNTQEKLIGALSSIVEQLEGRLGFVMRENVPSKPSEPDPSKTAIEPSLLAGKLRKHNDQVEDLASRIGSMLSRLEI